MKVTVCPECMKKYLRWISDHIADYDNPEGYLSGIEFPTFGCRDDYLLFDFLVGEYSLKAQDYCHILTMDPGYITDQELEAKWPNLDCVLHTMDIGKILFQSGRNRFYFFKFTRLHETENLEVIITKEGEEDEDR